MGAHTMEGGAAAGRSAAALVLAVAALAAVAVLVGVEDGGLQETGLEGSEIRQIPSDSLAHRPAGLPPVSSSIRRAVRRELRARDGMEQAQTHLQAATTAASKVTRLSEVAAHKSALVMQRVRAVVAAVKKQKRQASKNAALAALARHQVTKLRRAKLRAKIKADAGKFIDLEATKVADTVAESAAT